VAEHRHKRETNARRKPRAALVVGPIAVLATASVVTLGVLASSPETRNLVAEDTATDLSGVQSRDTVSRSESRSDSRLDLHAGIRSDVRVVERKLDLKLTRTATLRAVRSADTRLWTTTELNLWSNPGKDAAMVGELDAGDKVLVTGRKDGERVEVVVDGRSRWVTAGYLSEDKPLTAAAGLSMAPCPDPGVESGLTSSAVYVYRSVCNAFPQITSYGGWDAHGEHSSGRALDIMTRDVALGDAIAAFLQAHSAELNLYDILWRQQIWTPVRASEGWRTVPSRGSATADHYDHVHVSTN
jgi:hypothetical protein